MLAELQRRGLQLGAQRKDEYVNQLMEFEAKAERGERFLDRLLLFALIEARSCERFKRLSEGLEDAYLRQFYRRFMESEAGHYHLFIDLAETYIDKETVRRRWKEWLEYEAGVIATLGSGATASIETSWAPDATDTARQIPLASCADIASPNVDAARELSPRKVHVFH